MIYVATSWKNPDYEKVRDALRAAGHEVYDWKSGDTAFNWKDDAGLERTAVARKLPLIKQSVKARAAYEADIKAALSATLVILLLPSGKSAHMEFAAAHGRRVALAQTDLPLSADRSDWADLIIAVTDENLLVDMETLYGMADGFAFGIEDIVKTASMLRPPQKSKS